MFDIVVHKSVWKDGDWKFVETVFEGSGVFRDWDDVKDFVRRWWRKGEFIEEDNRFWGWQEFGDIRFDVSIWPI